ncbi:MAG: hypothetical protein H0T46_15075 [Deltaproteobacteria bacterium]|nr:hypothetical protein [Deltaproteobacteria bacterium]
MRIVIAVLVLVLATTTARAEEDKVSPTVANLLAFGGTVVPAGLFLCAANAGPGASDARKKTCGWAGLGGLVIGPTLGRWYAGDATVAGPLLRASGLVLFIGIATSSEGEPPPGELYVPVALLFAGAAIYDLAMTPKAVRARNRSVTVVPAVTSGPGVSLVGTF